ncbi:hypothetical protein DTO212C5_2713 [Paecilomyces variotii]|nr:hypothetical protein DTO212C5_2713 [Paecilomyces variotii]
MDSLSQLGTEIGSIAKPTHQIYAPLLSAREGEIKSVRREEHRYGLHSRQILDIYYPPGTPLAREDETETPTKPRPVLVFLYGGGLVSGSKSDPNFAKGTTYANVGSFFAKRFGFTVVIPDYRLIADGAQYPSGGEDVQLALKWVREVLPRQGSGCQSIHLSVMGNSAGGIHLTTYLFDEVFAESRAKLLTPINSCSSSSNANSAAAASVILKKVILLSVPFHFQQAHPRRASTLHGYFGPDLLVRSPYGLLQRAQERKGGLDLAGVTFAVVNATLDPEDEILGPREDFLRQWRAQEDPPLVSIMVQGHNHLSPPLAVGTGIEKEEAWAVQVGEFCEGA